MSISRQTQDKIRRYAREQSHNYLEDAEMTYLEKLRRKSGQTRQKFDQKLSRFKSSSERGLDAENDMILYMSDYIEDLIGRGMAEEEAFEKASDALRFDSESDEAADLNRRFQSYVENRDPAAQEAIGVFHGGFLLLGAAAGGLIAYLSGGGHAAFFSGGWIDAVIGLVGGGVAGIGLGLIANGVVAMRQRSE